MYASYVYALFKQFGNFRAILCVAGSEWLSDKRGRNQLLVAVKQTTGKARCRALAWSSKHAGNFHLAGNGQFHWYPATIHILKEGGKQQGWTAAAKTARGQGA